MTLLEEAKKIKPGRTPYNLRIVSDEELEIALAFFNNDITSKQAAPVLGFPIEKNTTTRVASWSGIVIRRAIRNRMLRLVLIPQEDN